MRGNSESKSSDLLARAVERIAFLEEKTKQVVYDELGYAIGRQGGSAVQYWVYHKKAPARLGDIESLARAIARMNGWENQGDLVAFLEQAGYPAAEYLARDILPAGPYANQAAAEGSPFGHQAAFMVGSPVLEPRLFFGRSRELRRIFNAVQSQNMQSVAIFGPAHSGKTSLLHYVHKITQVPPGSLRPGQFSNWLPRPLNYQWLYIDLQDPRVNSLEGLLSIILHRLNFPLPRSLDLPLFTDIICRYLADPTVILLDEFQLAVENPAFTRVLWQTFQSLAANLTNGKLAWIIAGTSSPGNILAGGRDNPAAPFLSLFARQLCLGPLDKDEAWELVNSSPIRFTPEDCDWILAQSGNWPAILQALCNERLLSLEEVQRGDAWKAGALEGIMLYRSLLEG